MHVLAIECISQLEGLGFDATCTVMSYHTKRAATHQLLQVLWAEHLPACGLDFSSCCVPVVSRAALVASPSWVGPRMSPGPLLTAVLLPASVLLC